METKEEMSLELEMRELRKLTNRCVLVEASLNPEEFLCTLGWHHRGQWFKDLQTSAETANAAVRLAKEEWTKDSRRKE